ncbi:tRNA (cytidine(56)-2'-O)-methyltransferase [Candidatus Vampirococcus lugosii]|uniref:tRNA (cytidine(56)-2'-O)-methyltransferase n=1 Tax=Candidatus Vampirococcus lugosii TaxID=2789015 RepID=A0ABS5QLW1_9BACT|nr:tRNA (cytidine(56)-2'-O)-methyltransferase [Candidatus Vampirococcus lugosii]MBS8122191.1 tRNA methyltransferase [Candidatus Vampirococcus lugosii]
MNIKILKLDHRPLRDKRITTHCALVSRAFKANSFFYSGIQDKNIEKNVLEINNKFGSSFEINYTQKPYELVKKLKKEKYIIIHLTMYGENITKKIKEIKNNKNILLIVGGPKVEHKYYEIANYNIGVTNQPHSEVAAIAMILYLIDNKSIENKDYNSEIKIIPNNDNKNVINLK